MAKHLVVIGGGAAGFFCAVNAARMSRKLQVTLIEKTGKLLSKVRVSGGGRCNVTHALFDITEMSSRYPRGQHFAKKTFHQFFTNDTIQWFEERGVLLKKEPDGRMFPVSDSSQTIINCLLNEAARYGVQILMNREVKELQYTSERFHIRFQDDKNITADYVCVAAGGYPKSSMFQWLVSTGHSIQQPVPSLFTFNLPKHPITALMGISVEQARVKIENTKLMDQGPVLITHWGLSGPAILRLSAWGARELASMNYECKVHINWLPEENEHTLKKLFRQWRELHPIKKLSNYNMEGLPSRLWLFLLQQAGISAEMRFADLPAKLENALIRNLIDYTVDVKGKTTFKEEFVTAGGIRLNEVDPNTLMSKKVPNLFFAGEILDIDGITGGFNFQNAWTTAFIAAKTITILAANA
jgi:predicted Rossmann fold flavoprotein